MEFSTSRAPSVPLHTNDRWDTGFYILDGEYSFVVADETVAASPGTWVYVPRETPHAWRCQAGESVPDRTRLPARSEPDVGALSSTAARYGIRIVGPPPGA